MEIIQNNNKLISNIIGNQIIDDRVEYRPIVFMIKLAVPGGFLLYNSLTKCLLFIELEEFNKDEIFLFLKENWFLVPSGFEERKLSDQIKSILKLLKQRKEGFSIYTIFTTMTCNARCFYCYEKHRKKLPMSDSVIRKASDFIVKTHLPGVITLRWFGGEPLCNVKAIDRVSERLRSENLDFYSTMISNGYLFTDSIIIRAKKSWNLKRVQITLDGTEKTYNSSKSYIYKNVNAYKRVLGNISRLISAEIFVQIRLNVSKKNIADLLVLLDNLKQQFGSNKYLLVYCYPLICFDTKNNVPINDEMVGMTESLNLINHKIELLGFRSKNSQIPKGSLSNMCIADNPEAITILPNGNMGKCEHYSEDHFIGNLDSPIYDKGEINKLSELSDRIPECDNCLCYPDCFLLKSCPDSSKCSVERKNFKIDNVKQQMLNTYNSYLKKQQITEDENDEIEIQC